MNAYPIVKPSLPPLKKYTEALQEVWNTRMLSNFSVNVQRLEKHITSYLGNKYVWTVTNGDVGLITALASLELHQDDEVILPSFTFNSTANAVVWNRLTPVFADIDERTLCIDPEDVRKKITKKTKVILGVHTFGNPCDVDKLSSIATANGCFLIFDSAHAYGSLYKGKKIGSFSDIDVFSLSGTKVVTTAEGGIITTNKKSIFKKISYIRNHGFLNNYRSEYIGVNGKMSELHATLGLLTLPLIEKEVKKRTKIVLLYRKLLKDVDGITFQEIDEQNRSTYKDFCILIKNRDALADFLGKYNIQTKKYFCPLHTMHYFKEYNTKLPKTETVARSILCLPIYNDIPTKDIVYICNKIKEFYSQKI